MLPTALTNRFVGAADNTSRPYKYMICRDGCLGAAGQTAPTNGLQPPLKTLFDVVNTAHGNVEFLGGWDSFHIDSN